MKTIELTDEEVRFVKESMKEKAYYAKKGYKDCIIGGYGFDSIFNSDNLGFYYEIQYRLAKSILEKIETEE